MNLAGPPVAGLPVCLWTFPPDWSDTMALEWIHQNGSSNIIIVMLFAFDICCGCRVQLEIALRYSLSTGRKMGFAKRASSRGTRQPRNATTVLDRLLQRVQIHNGPWDVYDCLYLYGITPQRALVVSGCPNSAFRQASCRVKAATHGFTRAFCNSNTAMRGGG